MRRLGRLAAAAALTGSLVVACGGNPGSREIVVTTNILGDVVRNIVGDAAAVRVLMKPNADPHSFGVSAQEAVAISGADLLVHNGLGLEEGLDRHVQSAVAGGVPAVTVGEHIDAISYASGESAGQPDPHFWMDPERMVKAVDVVIEAITQEVDVDIDTVERNASTYRDDLRSLATAMTETLSAIPADRRTLVTNHHVLGYFAQRYGFSVMGAIVPSGTTLAAPSSSDLQSLAGAITTARVPAIFVDSSQPQRLARVLAEQAGIEVRIVPLYTESLSPPGTPGSTYLDMMRANTDAIATALR
jgi:zinc/manganese transport system substrate-binding protein